jgi:hypothetical protein
MHRWINEEKRRYYQALLVKGLFGEWTLITTWGGLGWNRGGMKSTLVASYEAGLERIGETDKRRRQRGYQQVSSAIG